MYLYRRHVWSMCCHMYNIVIKMQPHSSPRSTRMALTARDSCKLWLSIIQPLSLLSGIPINGYCCHVCIESHIPLSEMVIRDFFNTPYPAWSLLIFPMMASTFLRYDTNYCKPQRGCDLSYHWLYHSFILVSSTTPQYQTYINSASATSSIDDQAC